MTYREMAIEITKMVGQELIDRADEMIPEVDGIKNVNIWIRIPSKSDDILNVPEIEVSAELYPKVSTLRRSLEMMEETE